MRTGMVLRCSNFIINNYLQNNCDMMRSELDFQRLKEVEQNISESK